MNAILLLMTSACFSTGLLAPNAEDPAQPAQPVAKKDAPTAMVSLWVVRFEPIVPRNSLPFNVQTIQFDNKIPDHQRSDASGRVSTNGWASSIATSQPAVEALGFRLAMKEGQLTTEPIDKANANATPPWQIVAAPKLLVQVDQKASMTVGRPVVHLVKESDGRLKLEEVPGAIEGVTIDLTVAWVKPKEIRFSDLTLRVSRVAGREPLPGVPLEVGKPVMESRETNLGLTLEQGKTGVIPLPEKDGEAPILVFITASPQK